MNKAQSPFFVISHKNDEKGGGKITRLIIYVLQSVFGSAIINLLTGNRSWYAHFMEE
jgi:hypothetical protein